MTDERNQLYEDTTRVIEALNALGSIAPIVRESPEIWAVHQALTRQLNAMRSTYKFLIREHEKGKERINEEDTNDFCSGH